MKYVYDDVAKMCHHPVAGGHAVNRQGLDTVILMESSFQLVDDGFEVRLAGSRADQKEIGIGYDSAQIDGDGALGFFVRGDPCTELEELC